MVFIEFNCTFTMKQIFIFILFFATISFAEDISKLKQSADQGDMQAQFALGVCFLYGDGVEKNYDMALKYFQLASNQGHISALYALATCYKDGHGVIKDERKAFEYLKKAADKGYEPAINEIAKYKEITPLQEAADKGDAQSQLRLAERYMTGNGVVKDLDKAIEYYKKAADQNNITAEYALACYYNEKRNFLIASKYYKKAADKGDAKSQYMLGTYYEYGLALPQNDDKALEYYKKAANQGDISAMFAAGDMYMVRKRDYKKAIEYLKEPAKLGYKNRVSDARALLLSAELYLKVEERQKALTELADNGDVNAQCKLGIALLKKSEVYSDNPITIAVKYLKSAADHGNADAQYALGEYHNKSNYVIEKQRGMEYYRKAANQGHILALYALDREYSYSNRNEDLKYLKEIFEYWRKRADIGDAKAQYIVSKLMYKRVSKSAFIVDEKKSCEYTKMSAMQGYAPAQYDYGYLLYCSSKEEALKWYRKAAEQGNIDAYEAIASYYQHGFVVKQDYNEAKKYYLKAAELNIPTRASYNKYFTFQLHLLGIR